MGITEFFLRLKSRGLRGETIGGRVKGSGGTSLLSKCGWNVYIILRLLSYIVHIYIWLVFVAILRYFQELVLFWLVVMDIFFCLLLFNGFGYIL